MRSPLRPDGRHVLVTGVPRSGTTLAASLVGSLANAVCLNEPWDLVERALAPAARAGDAVERLDAALRSLRAEILRTQDVENKVALSGGPVTNYVARDARGRVSGLGFREVRAPVRVDGADFLLAVKHNAPFLALLPRIARDARFAVIGMVRDPVYTLLSWDALAVPDLPMQFPMARGRLPSAERFWPEVAAVGRSDAPVLERQARLLELLCARLLAERERIALVRYEDLVAKPGLLEDVLSRPLGDDAPEIEPGNDARRYPDGDADAVLAALRAHAPSALALYPAYR